VYTKIFDRLLNEVLKKYAVGDVSKFAVAHKFSNDRLWNMVMEKLSRYLDHDIYIYVGAIDHHHLDDTNDFSEGDGVNRPFSLDKIIRDLRPPDVADRIFDHIDGNDTNLTADDIAASYGDDIKQALENNKKIKQRNYNNFFIDICKKYLGITESDINNSIVIFKTSEDQAEMSPWMMVHQIAEALMQAGTGASESSSGRVLSRDYQQAVDNLIKASGMDDSPLSNPSSRLVTTRRFASKIFKFNSARRYAKDGDLQFDVLEEMIVEYMWHGARLRYNVPEGFDAADVKRFVNDVESAIRKMLDSSVGEVIWMNN
jgi:hypothetical protein